MNLSQQGLIGIPSGAYFQIYHTLYHNYCQLFPASFETKASIFLLSPVQVSRAKDPQKI